MEKKIINETPGVAKPYAPYSLGIKVKKVGSFVFISGVVPNYVDGNIVCKGDIAGQTKQTVENLRITLEAAGATFKDVVKLNTYTTCMKEYLQAKANVDYLSRFSSPTETLVGVTALANEGQLIEIEAMAVTD